MVTITDPTGTPTITYNKSGKVIMYLQPNDGTAFIDAIEIPHLAEDTIVIINPALEGDATSGAIKFASDFDLGDRVTVHISHATCIIYDSSGNILDAPGNIFIMVNRYPSFPWT